MAARNCLADLIEDMCNIHDTIGPAATSLDDLDRFANEVMPLLRHPDNALAKELTALWDTIKSLPYPARAIYVIKPFTSITPQCKIARLQLLVLAVQGWSRGPFRIIPRTLGTAVTQLTRVKAEAKRAVEQYIQRYGAKTAHNDLINSLERLAKRRPAGIELDGRNIVVQGKRIPKPLTPMEQKFLAELLNAAGQEVSRQAFSRAGINQPGKIKSRLINKPDFGVLSTHIQAGQTGGYTLIQP